MSRRKISRRNFLGQASCAAIGSATFLNTALNLGVINTLAARPHIINSPNNDYKAMVCILLSGGADSFNLLVPTETSEYEDYEATRTSLALAQEDLLDLDYNDNGRTFGVHGGMSRVQEMFDDEKLAFIANIGTLIEPIANITEYQSNQKKIPLGLFSHSDQIMQWQSSVPQSRTALGVGGRIADILKDMNSLSSVSMNISLDGKNHFQSGNTVVEYSVANNIDPNTFGFEGINTYNPTKGILNQGRKDVVTGMLSQQYDNIFRRTYAGMVKQTEESIEAFRNALYESAVFETQFSETNLSQDLKMIARIISSNQSLGAKRQIFFTSFGGWDHHDDVLGNQSVMLPILSNALGEFYDALEEINMTDKVTTFTISDFARTLTTNGNGSDHAWGGNVMIMGGNILGKHIYGDFPSLNLDGNPLNLNSRGRLIPTTSVDEFFAELALWFGVSPNDLSYVLPNLCNFYDPTCSAPPSSDYSPLGMFASYD